MKPPPDRLYGRQRTHALRPRQEKLLAITLPRLRFTTPQTPLASFAFHPAQLWLEVGFGGGEHARALAAAHPDAALIACEVFDQGMCSMLAALVPEGGEADAPLPRNLRIWDDDARILLRTLPQACLDALFLMFPDPWPKARHAKRRFVHPDIAARGLAHRQRRSDIPGLGAGGHGRPDGVWRPRPGFGAAGDLAADALRGKGHRCRKNTALLGIHPA
jgi:tRNA G46 methylase TrmB